MDYYGILDAPKDASAESLRQNYIRLAKQFHPDKRSGANDKRGTDPTNLSSEFVRLEQAYKVLADPTSRAIYDAEHTKHSRSHCIWNEITLEEMQRSQDGDEYSYPCRCGDFYRAAAETIRESVGRDITLPCSSCSFSVLLKARHEDDAGCS